MINFHEDNVAFIEKASIVFVYKICKFRESIMPLKPNSPEARDVAYLVHPYTNLRANEEQGPMIIEKGEGVYVWDNGGKKYIEGMAYGYLIRFST